MYVRYFKNSHHWTASGCGTAHINTYMTEKKQLSKGVWSLHPIMRLYLGADVLGVGLSAVLMQVMDRMQFPRNEVPWQCNTMANSVLNNNLTSTETWCGNIEKEALGILHDLEKLNHYCFTYEVSIIMYHKLLVVIFKKM